MIMDVFFMLMLFVCIKQTSSDIYIFMSSEISMKFKAYLSEGVCGAHYGQFSIF